MMASDAAATALRALVWRSDASYIGFSSRRGDESDVAKHRLMGGRVRACTPRQRRATGADRPVDFPLRAVYAGGSRASGVQPTADGMWGVADVSGVTLT